ncbi:hypothetical protein C8A03DRAFT_12662, partial [Achaetomium macrosporum]
QDPALEIQILPSEEASYSSCAVGGAVQRGGSAMVKELERTSERFGFFPATLMLPTSTETTSMTVKASRRPGTRWHPWKATW